MHDDCHSCQRAVGYGLAMTNPSPLQIGMLLFPGVTQLDLPNNHLSYAFTWYGLAAVLVVVSVLAFRRKAR